MSDRPVVLVTGARKGLGRYLAEQFLAQGALVEGCSRRPAGWSSANYIHHETDICQERQVVSLMTSIAKRHGRLDILINNAGASSLNHTLLMPVAAVDQIMSTNFRGLFLVSRESAKLMKRRNYGRVVSVGSVAVPLKIEGEAVYAASKSALETFTRILARELADFGITCNVVAPGPLPTDMTRGIGAARIKRVLDRMTLKRWGTFEEVGHVVDFLVSAQSGGITGQVIYLGGVS